MYIAWAYFRNVNEEVHNYVLSFKGHVVLQIETFAL